MRSIDTVRWYLRRRGIDDTVYESAPGRGNLVARIHGAGGGSSPTESGFVDAMTKAVKAEMPGAALIPETIPGKTDFRFLRSRGVECYGYGRYGPETPQESMRVHASNERVSLKTPSSRGGRAPA